MIVCLSGCVAARQRANDLAEHAVYKPIVYENTDVQGPRIVVLPGTITSRSFAFTQKVGENSIRDFAEIELSKANFQIQDKAESRQFFKEIGIAANLGDQDAMRLFRAKSFPEAGYLLKFDVVKAEPVAWASSGGNGEVAGALIQLGFTLATQGKDDAIGKALGNAVASIKHYEVNATWVVQLDYKVIDVATGREVVGNTFSEQFSATTELNAALGVSQKEQRIFSVDSVLQQLVQKAVADLNSKHKEQLIAGAAKPLAGNIAFNTKQEKAMLLEFQKKAADYAVEQDKKAAVAVYQSWMHAYATLDFVSYLELSSPAIHSFIKKEMGSFFTIPDKIPDWRNAMTIDVSNVEAIVANYAPEKCVIKVSGYILFGDKGKEGKYAQDESTDMVKEDGKWKVASLKVEHTDRKGPAKSASISVAPSSKEVADKFIKFKIARANLADVLNGTAVGKNAAKRASKNNLQPLQDALTRIRVVVENYAKQNGIDFILQSEMPFSGYEVVAKEKMVYCSDEKLPMLKDVVKSNDGLKHLNNNGNFEDVTSALIVEVEKEIQ
jgi:hypothetical protein